MFTGHGKMMFKASVQIDLLPAVPPAGEDMLPVTCYPKNAFIIL